MTKVTIIQENPTGANDRFRASTSTHQATGRTAGAALDALTAQLTDDAGTLVVVQSLKPDAFFTADQQRRLELLMQKWRSARDAGESLSADEQRELEALIGSELDGTTHRANAMAQELRR